MMRMKITRITRFNEGSWGGSIDLVRHAGKFLSSARSLQDCLGGRSNW